MTSHNEDRRLITSPRWQRLAARGGKRELRNSAIFAASRTTFRHVGRSRRRGDRPRDPPDRQDRRPSPQVVLPRGGRLARQPRPRWDHGVAPDLRAADGHHAGGGGRVLRPAHRGGGRQQRRLAPVGRVFARHPEGGGEGPAPLVWATPASGGSRPSRLQQPSPSSSGSSSRRSRRRRRSTRTASTARSARRAARSAARRRSARAPPAPSRLVHRRRRGGRPLGRRRARARARSGGDEQWEDGTEEPLADGWAEPSTRYGRRPSST